MINPDELGAPRPKTEVKNLESMSIQDLKHYIVSLEQEIERAQAMIDNKQAHRSGADNLFKF